MSLIAISRADARKYGLGKAVSEFCGYKSALERRYAELLQARKLAGEVLDWKYEAVSLRLTKHREDGKRSVTFWPDFLVVDRDGFVSFHEVKGLRTERGRLKYEWAVEQFPWFRFVFVDHDGGEWHYNDHAVGYRKGKK